MTIRRENSYIGPAPPIDFAWINPTNFIILELQKSYSCLFKIKRNKRLFENQRKFVKVLTWNSLWHCSNLDKLLEFQRNMGSLKHLGLDETAIRELPSSIGHLTGLDVLCLNDIAIKELLSSIHHLTQLQCLEMRKCKNLTSLPSNFYRLKSLSECFLDGCSNLEVFPKITKDMENLQRLGLIELPIKDLPSSIERLKSLSFLELNNCENLETLPNSIGNLTSIVLFSFITVQSSTNCSTF